MKKKAEVIGEFDCGDGAHRVITVSKSERNHLAHRTTPCDQCPWRADLPVGEFPVAAYRHSATTAYDMAQNIFGCHMQGMDKPATCAGFLMRGADHNLMVRMAIAENRYHPKNVSDGGYPLYEDYRAMAEANGVSPDDPVLAPCRDNRPYRRKA